MTVTELLISGAEKLQGVSTLPFLDAEVLLAHVLKQNRAYIIAHSNDVVGIVEERQYNNLIGRREAAEPIAYITQHKEFYGLDFYVDDRVLIPRPETELIVDVVKEVVTERYGTREHARVLEIGTGSGCIAISMSKTLDDQVHVVAADISADALEVAKYNAERHKVPVEFLHGNVYTPLPDGIAPFDIIVSNPPYLTQEEAAGGTAPEQRSLTHEPDHALVASDGGFAVIAQIITGAQQWLLPYGVMVLEIGDNHQKRVKDLAGKILPSHTVEFRNDFGGKVRFAIFWPTTK